MRMPRVRLTFRGTMIAVALFALNLCGALATYRYFPVTPDVSMIIGDGPFEYIMNADGSQYMKVHGSTPSFPRMVRPPRPTLARLCSPIIACAGLTLLTLCYVGRDRFHNPRLGRVVLVAFVLLSTVSLRWWWVLEGRSLPLWRLHLGMTKPEVLAVVGPVGEDRVYGPNWLVAPYGSLYWLNLAFDDKGRLRAYPPDRHRVGKLGKFHPNDF